MILFLPLVSALASHSACDATGNWTTTLSLSQWASDSAQCLGCSSLLSVSPGTPRRHAASGISVGSVRTRAYRGIPFHIDADGGHRGLFRPRVQHGLYGGGSGIPAVFRQSLGFFTFSMLGIVLRTIFRPDLSSSGNWSVSPVICWSDSVRNRLADAAKKAFLTNRVGDFGFLPGI